MRARVAWIAAGLTAAAALARVLGSRRRTEPPMAAPGGVDPRAEELRRRLAEARSLAGEREDFESAELPVDQAHPAEEGLDERRRTVHEQARATVDEIRGRSDT